jgi:hypothetical protein
MSIATIIKGSSKVIKEKSVDIDNQIKAFDKRLKLLEKQQ